ncbi:MAG: hypothetical protein ABJC04_05395 [Verrucomicrobiota bacterium]
MKKVFLALLAMAVAFATAFSIASKRQLSIDAKRLTEQQSAWLREKAQLESALRQTRADPAAPKFFSTQVTEVEKKQSAKEIIASLKKLAVSPGQTQNIRQAIQQLENLIGLGQSALPDIQSFLATQEDRYYDPASFASWKISKTGNVPIDFVFPPSLRFGLFDVARKIGGAQAEKLLADTLRVTGRGVEVAYLSRVLQEMAPFQYRELAVSVAKDLLANPLNVNSANALDKYDRNYLFGVLAFYHDGSLALSAQNQLVQSDGKIDQAALTYLHNTLAEKAVGVAAAAYQDTRIDPTNKEPLARVALYYAGLDQQANELFHQTINDPGLPLKLRRELVEDLNQDGISNEKNPTPADQKLIDARLKLIDSYSGAFTEDRMIAALAEAKKDLLNLQQKATGRPAN